MEQDKSKTFVQKYEQELRHFGKALGSMIQHALTRPVRQLLLLLLLSGMLRRWDDSQRFLSDLPQLICEDTANYLILWCFGLQAEEVRNTPMHSADTRTHSWGGLLSLHCHVSVCKSRLTDRAVIPSLHLGRMQ